MRSGETLRFVLMLREEWDDICLGICNQRSKVAADAWDRIRTKWSREFLDGAVVSERSLRLKWYHLRSCFLKKKRRILNGQTDCILDDVDRIIEQLLESERWKELQEKRDAELFKFALLIEKRHPVLLAPKNGGKKAALEEIYGALHCEIISRSKLLYFHNYLKNAKKHWENIRRGSSKKPLTDAEVVFLRLQGIDASEAGLQRRVPLSEKQLKTNDASSPSFNSSFVNEAKTCAQNRISEEGLSEDEDKHDGSFGAESSDGYESGRESKRRLDGTNENREPKRMKLAKDATIAHSSSSLKSRAEIFKRYNVDMSQPLDLTGPEELPPNYWLDLAVKEIRAGIISPPPSRAELAERALKVEIRRLELENEYLEVQNRKMELMNWYVEQASGIVPLPVDELIRRGEEFKKKMRQKLGDSHPLVRQGLQTRQQDAEQIIYEYDEEGELRSYRVLD